MADYAHRAGPIGQITIEDAGTIPFYENPKIRETRKAGYNRTNIFKRNEPIRLWTGTGASLFEVEIRYTLPHMVALGGMAVVKSAIRAARESVKGHGRQGPGVARMSVGTISYPPCIITDYEMDMTYEHGSFLGDSRVIVLRLKMEEYHGI